MYIRCVANSNWKLWTTEKRQHHFGITGNIVCVPIHAFALHSDTQFFQRSFAQNLKNISPIVWYCCNIRRPYKISNILHKINEKAVFFFIDDICNVTWPFPSAFIFPAAWRVFVWKQWCDVGTVVWCRTCTVLFFRSLLRLFSRFLPIWCAKWKYCEKWHLPMPKIWNPFFFILSQVQREGFHYDKAISCKCYVQLLIQDVYSILSKTCQLWVNAFWRLFSGVARIFC